MKKFLLFLILALTLSIIPSVANALEYGGVGGKPANPREDNERSKSIFIYELKPGESYSDGVSVVNNTGETKKIKITAVDSSVASDGAFACAQESEDKVDVGSWITLEDEIITLETGKTQVVDFTVKVPENASVGEHSGCVAMQAVKEASADPAAGGVVLSFRSAIRVSVTIPGDIVKAITISNVSLEPNLQDSTKYTIQPSLSNTGNVSLDATIGAKLVSLFGVTTTSNKSTYPVLPGTTARWNFDVDRPYWGGFFHAVVDTEYNGNVDEGVGEDDNQNTITSSGTSGYVFITPAPIALLIEVLVLLGFLTALFLVIRRLRHRSTVKKRWSHHTVAEGESLQKIAKHYHVSWKRLASANRIRAPYHIEPGHKLKVPPKPQGK